MYTSTSTGLPKKPWKKKWWNRISIKTGTGDEKVKHEKDNGSPENDDKTDAECEKEEIGGNGKDAGK